MMTLTSPGGRLATGLLVAAGLGGCTNESARAPNPVGYDWPETFAYRVDYIAETVRDTEVVSRYVETKTLRFVVRDDRYLVWNDSVSKIHLMPGTGPQGGRIYAEDTLRFFVRLTRLGEFDDVEPGCDPAIAACHDALPSALPLELRLVIPRLPVWWPPKGHDWVDTLRFDDLPRPDGARGSVVTAYRDLRDTVVEGRSYWRVTWKSVRRAARPVNGAMVDDPAVEERGDVLVDKERLVPVAAGWYGALAAPPALRALGVTATAFRGRAWLAGTVFDSLLVGR
jgi:hypothetical protein